MEAGVSRLLGDGYEPHVDAVSGELLYSLPVESGFVSAAFSFVIRRSDLDVLLGNPYRRATLEVIAHTLLQRSMLPGSARFTQPMFDALLAEVLHSTAEGLEDSIVRIGRAHNIAIPVFIEQALARRASGG
jgi:hypothetical protein